MTGFVRHYLLAIQFFTRIPVTGALADWVGYSPQMLRASAAHFPGVGWLVGGVVAVFTWAVLALLPAGPQMPFAPLVAATLGTVLTVLMTGAFHEDGLADVADGLGGAQSRERALEIMKDSRVGAFGAIAVALALLLKVALLALLGSVGPMVLCVGLFTAHVVSRTWPLLIIRLLPHVGDLAGSKSKPLAEQVSLPALAAALLWCFLALALAVFAQAAIKFAAICTAVLASALACVWMWRWFARRLQGFTGDCLGATQQVCELAFYLGLAVACGMR
jgi:adenosylcobinamide-GDP ribazoletransferase